jgi:hypothetical protein
MGGLNLCSPAIALMQATSLACISVTASPR